LTRKILKKLNENRSPGVHFFKIFELFSVRIKRLI
jgi:hypothetical protein